MMPVIQRHIRKVILAVLGFEMPQPAAKGTGIIQYKANKINSSTCEPTDPFFLNLASGNQISFVSQHNPYEPCRKRYTHIDREQLSKQCMRNQAHRKVVPLKKFTCIRKGKIFGPSSSNKAYINRTSGSLKVARLVLGKYAIFDLTAIVTQVPQEELQQSTNLFYCCMGTTYTCTCESTGNYEYCSCGCNTCQDLCSTCPTWYWYVLGAGVLLGIILGIIGFMRRRKQRLLRNKPLTINLNAVQVGPGQPNQMPQQVQQQQQPRPQPQQAQQRSPQQAQQAQPRKQAQQPRQQPQPQQYQQYQQAQQVQPTVQQ